MEKKISFFVIAALVTGLSLFAAPSISHALTVNTVNVAIGANNFSLAGWNLPIALSANQTLVLGQLNSFAFNTSDALCGGSTNCPLPVVTINGQSFTDTTNVLHLKNADPGTNEFNEAQQYKLLGFGSSSDGHFLLSVAYADNLHLDACGSGANSLGLTGESNCLPSPFDGSGGTTRASVFRLDDASAPSTFPTGPADGIHCTRPGASRTACWDTALVMITATPEPSALFLLVTGLVTLLAYGWRWKKPVA
jgi:hypothetical protein